MLHDSERGGDLVRNKKDVGAVKRFTRGKTQDSKQEHGVRFLDHKGIGNNLDEFVINDHMTPMKFN